MRKLLPLLTALVLHAVMAFTQTRTISGQVKDAKGDPVPFATIKIKGSKLGAAADASGNFSIQAPGTAILIISAAGFQPLQVPTGSSGPLTVTLLNSQDNLSEVVVTALGIRRTKNDLPYAAKQITAAEITKTRTDNFATALSGKVAGLTIKTNNNMGGSTDIILRGYKSITGDNQAMIVIDGIPVNNTNVNSFGQTEGRAGYDYGNTGADINPDDIESINVLKGAASTALYG